MEWLLLYTFNNGYDKAVHMQRFATRNECQYVAKITKDQVGWNESIYCIKVKSLKECK